MSAPSSSAGRILIGEDTADIAVLIHEVLEHAGYSVETTLDGAACLERARESRPDLVVLDIMMPKMHGIDVLKALQADSETAGIGVLMCTAKDFTTERRRCRELGAFGVLVKPFQAAELLELVHGFFAERGRTAPARPTPSPPREPEEEEYLPVLDTADAVMRLWGTRGSIPTPGPRYVRHGGNTSCFSVTAGEECFIFDAGSGIRELGVELVKSDVRRLHLFITHTHWDHIQGFPFFAPAYRDDFQITIYGASGFGKDLASLMRGQLDRDYFPVQMDDLAAGIEFVALPDPPLMLGPAAVTWEFAEHPGATLAYRIEVNGRSVAWVPDNEVFRGYTGDPLALHRYHAAVQPFDSMIRFLAGTDLVIHEAQYTNREYGERIGYGHSSVSNAAVLMKLADVPRWIVTHHDPAHQDEALEAKLSLTRQIMDRLGHPCLVTHGYEGLTEYY